MSYGKNRYALIINMETLPHPMLVECGRTNRLTTQQLQHYGRKLIILPPLFDELCRAILHKPAMKHVKMRFKMLVLDLMLSKRWRNMGRRRIEKYLLTSIIDHKILCRLPRQSTRGMLSRFGSIRKQCIKIRKHRQKEEMHLPLCFTDGITRSLRMEYSVFIVNRLRT